MTTKEKQDIINTNIRYIAYKVFSKKPNFMFTNAYDKLSARVYLDHDFKISELTKGSKKEHIKMFDVLSSSELNMVLDSSRRLRKMYDDVFSSKAM